MAKAIGPYSPVVHVGHWVICSGQLALVDGSLVEGGVTAQATQAIKNLASLLESERSGLADVVKTTVFLADMGDFAAMNEAYVAGFGDSRPARSAVAVAGLPMGALFEIEAWAHSAHPRNNPAS
jgi:2-iminobutanoate/2-iminopropanoate deaminase